MENSKLERIIYIIRTLKEEGVSVSASIPTNNASSGQIAGLPPDQPPVFAKKKKNIYLGIGSRSRWMNMK
jgi:hypothetical protein